MQILAVQVPTPYVQLGLFTWEGYLS